jgi:hypothetical protein
LAAGLAMERDMISYAMQHLVAVRLVTVVRRGRFQLHPMLAAYDTPRDQQRAIAACAWTSATSKRSTSGAWSSTSSRGPQGGAAQQGRSHRSARLKRVR